MPRADDQERTIDGSRGGLIDQLLEQTSQPFLAADFDGRIIRSNRAFQEMLGFSAAELATRNLRDLTSQASWSTTEHATERIATSGKAQRYEKEYLHRDGHPIPVALVTDFYRDEYGEPRGYYAFITDISERVRTEHALRQSEERFRQLYDFAPVGYHEINTDARIVSINLTECEMLGYTREEMLGRSILDFVAPEAREQSARAVAERLKIESEVQTVERPYLTKDGRQIEFSIQNRLIHDDQGQIVGIRSAVQDITRRKQTEAALRASERRARALFEGIEDSVFVHDMDGRILDANPAASRRLGYTREEFLTLTTRDVDDPDFAAGYEDRLAAQLKDRHLTCEGRHRTKDGRSFPVEINTSTIRLENEPVVIAVIRDITERKALEETRREFVEAQGLYAREMEVKNSELSSSEARYRELAEGSLDAIVVADQSGRITLFNRAAHRTFGLEPSEVLGQPITILMPESFWPLHSAGFQHYLETRDPRVVGRTVELRGIRKDGTEFPLELSLSAVEVEGALQFIGSIRDLTERQRMRDLLVQSEKLASIGLLSAGVAHEINNPLAYIANNLAVLDRDMKGIVDLVTTYETADPLLRSSEPATLKKIEELRESLDWDYVRENMDRMLARTREGVQRVASIVQNLRGLARTSPPKMEPALLADLATTAIEMVQGRLKRENIELKFEPEELPKIACVAPQINQVILNLLVNAIQAIESNPAGRRKQITIRVGGEGDDQFVEIEDTGCGIEPRAMANLFDPFFTTKPVGEGTGLGLSISHGIIDGHGGRIEVASQPGQGSTFRIILPANVSI